MVTAAWMKSRFSSGTFTTMHDQPMLSADEWGRYARHLILPEVGPAGQLRLKSASVLCVDSGGLGSHLHCFFMWRRLVIHSSSGVGCSKARSVEAQSHDLNPHCQVEVHEHMSDVGNALDLIGSYDLVCTAPTTSPAGSINDACVLLGKPLVDGSVQRFDGQFSVFNRTPTSPNYRDLLPEPPPLDAVPSCSEAGVMGVLPGLIGVL